MPVEPSPDAYGNKARASAVADWIELLAWQEKPVTLASAIDYFGDLNYPEGTLLPDDGTSADAADEEEFSDWVRSVLARRIELLGGLYPFELVGERLRLRDDVIAQDSVYVLLLAITIAHAYEVDTTTDPADMFEATVARCLNRRMKAVDLGNLRDAHPNFHDAVFAAGTAIGLEPSPSAASSAAAARDEGVDTIGHWDWGDRRPGRWTVIGQATCGKSTTWKRKMAEPGAGIWSTRLADHVHPLGFLAVPHHVEDRFFYYLVENGERSVVDRIRLALCEPTIEATEQILMREVFDAGVASP
jgi:hypothetical protein